MSSVVRAIAARLPEGKRVAASLCLAVVSVLLMRPLTSVAAPSAPYCRIEAVNFEGWAGQSVSNKWIKLTVVPQLGGRVMQVEFAGHPYLFINNELKGRYFPPTEGAGMGKWFNYGGDKIWPLPEGRKDDQHWPGPISDVLDDGDYKFTTVSESPNCTIRLEGPADERTGLQYTREITLGRDSPKIAFRAAMKNTAQRTIRWSVQSVTQYDTADPQRPGAFRKNFWAFAPANANSAYFKSYYVRSGLSDDPSFASRDGLFILHWLNLQNEVWLDSPDGWLAVVDGDSEFAMIERFHFQADAEYPGRASVIFYKNGPAVRLDRDGNPFINDNEKEDRLRYMEAEVNSPMVELAPGQSYTMETEWFPTRSGSDLKTVTPLAVFGKPIQAKQVGETISLSGEFGVLFPGTLLAVFQDASGRETGQVSLRRVDPSEKIILRFEVKRPPQASSVVLALKGVDGTGLGTIGDKTSLLEEGKN
jgi:hypothetical protein